MIEIPGIIPVVIYGVIAASLLINGLLNLYHAFRFGSNSPITILSSGIYLAGLGVILFTTWFFLRDVSFNQSFSIEFPTISLFPASQ